MSRPKGRSELLTAVELEFMIILWEIGSGSVRDVLERLDSDMKRAYTSVATTMRILDGKGYLEATKMDRTFIYSPSLSKQEYEGKTLRSLADSLFNGAPTALVARLVDDEDLTEETIKEIRDIIDTKIGR